TPLTIQGKPKPIRVIGGVIYFLFLLLLFFVSIELMGTAFEMFGGRGLADQLLSLASNPVSGLLIGFLATSLVQSSSTTTTLVVIMVGAGTIDIGLAVPIVMGANIGTTTTNTIVSIGHVTRPAEFERAFAASTVHDFFNVLAAFTLLPVEVYFHPIERTAVRLQGMFAGAAGGVGWVSPLKALRDPPADFIAGMVTNPFVLLILALALLLLALRGLLVLMRGAVLERLSGLFDRVLFRNDAASFALGVAATATVQSSSATTSLIVPLAGTGVLSLRQIFPYTIGANIGTTITAILASLGTGSEAAMIVALAHLTFNVFAVLIFYPLKALPIWLATGWGAFAARSKAGTATVLSVYVALHVIPLAFIFLARG
ncbi:MAG: Na/Pi symporter, partial [Gemmatimonadota bacterium]|nr:Na/Pi symporter [Gemmatimonadota bacterium]